MDGSGFNSNLGGDIMEGANLGLEGSRISFGLACGEYGSALFKVVVNSLISLSSCQSSSPNVKAASNLSSTFSA